MASQASDDDLEKTYIYHQLDEYAWDDDAEFQGGLRAILGSVQDPARVQHLTLRAKCYYYARKAGVPVDFEGYKQWRENLSDAAPVDATPAAYTDASPPGGHQSPAGNDTDGLDGGLGDAPKPASFAEICEWIAEGKPIPGVKDIPDTILDGQASESNIATRKKPWERPTTLQAAEKPSWMS